jgi:hypothetical protein
MDIRPNRPLSQVHSFVNFSFIYTIPQLRICCILFHFFDDGEFLMDCRDILTPGESEERLLLNWTRQSTTNGIKWYSSRE